MRRSCLVLSHMPLVSKYLTAVVKSNKESITQAKCDKKGEPPTSVNA